MVRNIAITTVLAVGGLLLLNSLGKDSNNSTQSQKPISQQAPSNTKNQSRTVDSFSPPADSIEVVNFHGTQRCVSCKAVGRLTRKTLEEKFTAELASGTIVLKEINGELPENRELVEQYQARGSSVFINGIKDGQNHITEETTIWRLINDEDQFVSHLSTVISSLLKK